MSWVTIAVFAILILFGVSGWRKGQPYLLRQW
mgnify:CR=1 FL=1